MKLTSPLFFFALLLACTACEETTEPTTSLPILGNRDVVDGDTVYHQISDFRFVNQDSQLITNASFEDKIYITDFFFTSCPTICPKVKQQMLRVYERFEQDPRVVLLSHTVDVKRDTVGKLKSYADKLAVKTDKWHFVTGDEDALYEMADEYFIVATKDPGAPGGFDHSGRLILVDKNRMVRAFANGTDPDDVSRFMTDIEQLLDES